MVKFIIGIVVALMIFIPTILWAGRLFRLSDDAKDSFDELIQKINDISGKPAGTIEPIAFHMDKDTAVLGFAKNAQKLQGISFGEEISYFERPDSCEGDRACLCLCRNGYGRALTEGIYSDVPDAEKPPYWLLTCSNLMCTSMNEKVDFPKTISAESLAKPKKDVLLDWVLGDSAVKIEGGFVLERGKLFFNLHMEDSGRGRPIYIKNKESTVVLCRSPELCDK